MIGCFGDALIRRYAAEPPDVWIMAVAMLRPEQLSRGMRRLIAGGNTSPPSLPAFVRLCRHVGDDDEPRPQPAALAEPEMDGWTVEGNRRLLAHIRNTMARDPKRYGQPASYAALQLPKHRALAHGLDVNNLDASPEFVFRVNLLRDAKNNWATDMRDLSANDSLGRVPMPLANATWKDYINRAESIPYALEENW